MNFLNRFVKASMIALPSLALVLGFMAVPSAEASRGSGSGGDDFRVERRFEIDDDDDFDRDFEVKRELRVRNGDNDFRVRVERDFDRFSTFGRVGFNRFVTAGDFRGFGADPRFFSGDFRDFRDFDDDDDDDDDNDF